MYDFGEGWAEKVTGWLSEEEYAQDNSRRQGPDFKVKRP